MLKRNLYYLLSPRLRLFVRRWYYFPIDTYECLTGKRPANTPPRGMVFVGYGDYIAVGKRFAAYFIKPGGLHPHHRVLDVGCGIGRMAVPLIDFLGNKGSYEGFDIVKKGIVWCNKHINTKHPNFRFTYVDLHNELYNANNSHKADNFIFPYKDAEFDFVFLTSVFTHMMPSDTEHYLGEISRVLKPGGKCLATFFLLNDESKSLLDNGSSFMTFDFAYGNYRLHSQKVKTANVAYEEHFILSLLAKYNMELKSSHYGQWSSRKEYFDYQDILVVQKKETM